MRKRLGRSSAIRATRSKKQNDPLLLLTGFCIEKKDDSLSQLGVEAGQLLLERNGERMMTDRDQQKIAVKDDQYISHLHFCLRPTSSSLVATVRMLPRWSTERLSSSLSGSKSSDSWFETVPKL